ncbi:MAG: LytR C-terminal domain-containing protein [Candidatus Krumholzibacteriales bacterium]
MTAKRKKKKKKKFSLVIWLLPLIVMIASLSIKISGAGGRGMPEPGAYQLEVLNGTGEKNLVKEATRQLRRMGIDVLIEGNAEFFGYERSVIIDRKGNPELAERVARRLGCETVIRQLQDNARVDLTFILGDDKDKLDIDIQADD